MSFYLDSLWKYSKKDMNILIFHFLRFGGKRLNHEHFVFTSLKLFVLQKYTISHPWESSQDHYEHSFALGVTNFVL